MLPHHTKITKYVFAAFIVLVIGYAYISSRNLLWGPIITLNAPDNGITVYDGLIEISGTVENVAEITLSGRSVFITEEGVFTERLLLAEGVNRFLFEAEDKFGRKTKEVLEIVYIPTEQETSPPQQDGQQKANLDTIE